MIKLYLSLLQFLITGILIAQDNVKEFDQDIAYFKEKQDKISLLIKKQEGLLDELIHEVKRNEKKMEEMSEFLSYPKNVKYYRDTSIKQIVEIRKTNDRQKQYLHQLYFDWFPFHSDIMAIYTRFGELKMIDKVDDSLKQFLADHRKNISVMRDISNIIDDIYKETDFLLNSKLE